MNFTAPVSQFMTRKLVTVLPTDKLDFVRDIFEKQNIHHLPVVKFRTLVGFISKTDLLNFRKGLKITSEEALEEKARLKHYSVEDIMKTGIATLEPTDRLNVALQLFLENRFHALPIVENGELVGMLTTFDIIKLLVEEDNARIKGA
jgi:acetoin utilization protein AcuB